jgi:hypothetical protein
VPREGIKLDLELGTLPAMHRPPLSFNLPRRNAYSSTSTKLPFQQQAHPSHTFASKNLYLSGSVTALSSLRVDHNHPWESDHVMHPQRQVLRVLGCLVPGSGLWGARTSSRAGQPTTQARNRRSPAARWSRCLDSLW